MGDEATHWEGICRIPPQGGLQAHREVTSESEGRSLDIPPAGGCNDRIGTVGGGELSLPPTESGCTVNCDQDHYVTVYGSGAENRAKDIQVVVRIGRDGCLRDSVGGLVGVTERGGGGGYTGGKETGME